VSQPTCTQCDRKVQARGMCTTHYSLWLRAENAERNTFTCTHCGDQFKTWRTKQAACSLECQRRKAISAAQVIAVSMRAKGQHLLHIPYAAFRTDTHVYGKTWTAGPCAQCGDLFVGRRASRYCTDRCAARAKHRMRNLRWGDFTVSDITRQAIYRRDGHICQLCMTPVDPTLHYNDKMSATLDHIIPQSFAQTPDHSPDNLRLAHRMCNSVRGNDTEWTFTAAA